MIHSANQTHRWLFQGRELLPGPSGKWEARAVALLVSQLSGAVRPAMLRERESARRRSLSDSSPDRSQHTFMNRVVQRCAHHLLRNDSALIVRGDNFNTAQLAARKLR